MPPFRSVLLFILAAILSPVTHAHVVGESRLALSADQENLEVLVSLPLTSAASLLPADAEPLSSATLDQHRPALLAGASRLCVLSDAAGAPIDAQRVLVSIFQDHEVRFHFLYSPDARPARLRVPQLGAPRGDSLCVVSDLRAQPPLHAALTAAAPEFIFPVSAK